jgi:hypothetical protein
VSVPQRDRQFSGGGGSSYKNENISKILQAIILFEIQNYSYYNSEHN